MTARYKAQEVTGSGGEQTVVLSDRTHGMEAVIVPGVGNQCMRWTYTHEGQSVDLIARPPDWATLRDDPMHYGNPILFPFPNRIRHGEYRFEGQSYTLPQNEEERPHAIHGLVFDRPWQLVDSGADEDDGAWVTSRFDWADFPELADGFPFPFTLEYTYRLKDGQLFNEVQAVNTGDGRMPMGFGLHPWFRMPLSDKGTRARCRLEAPVSHIWELDEAELIPTGTISAALPERDLRRGPELGDQMYDDVYAGLNDGTDREPGSAPTGGMPTASRARFADPGTGIEVAVRADGAFRELVIFAPLERDILCIEPYTCTTDAFNLHERDIDGGMMILEPGESWSGTISFAAGPYDPDTWPSL